MGISFSKDAIIAQTNDLIREITSRVEADMEKDLKSLSQTLFSDKGIKKAAKIDLKNIHSLDEQISAFSDFLEKAPNYKSLTNSQTDSIKIFDEKFTNLTKRLNTLRTRSKNLMEENQSSTLNPQLLRNMSEKIENFANSYKVTREEFYELSQKGSTFTPFTSLQDKPESIGYSLGKLVPKKYPSIVAPSSSIKKDNLEETVDRINEQLKAIIKTGPNKNEVRLMTTNTSANRGISYIDKKLLPTVQQAVQQVQDMVFYDIETVGDMNSDEIRTTQLSMTKGSTTLNAFVKLSDDYKAKLEKSLERLKKGYQLSKDEERELMSFANIVEDIAKKQIKTQSIDFGPNFKLTSTSETAIKRIKQGIEIMAGATKNSTEMSNLYNNTVTAWDNLLSQLGINENNINQTIFGGEKVTSFDNVVLRSEGVTIPKQIIDTLSLAWQFFDTGSTRKGKDGKIKTLTGYGMDPLSQFLEVTIDKALRHTAGADTIMNQKIMEGLVSEIGLKKLKGVMGKELSTYGTPIGVASRRFIRNNDTSFKTIGGQLPKEADKFKDVLFSKDEAYEYLGTIWDETIQLYRANFKSITNGEQISISGSLGELESIINSVFNGDFTRQNAFKNDIQNNNGLTRAQEVARNLIANLFKPGSNSFKMAGLLFESSDENWKVKREFLQEFASEYFKRAKEAFMTIKQKTPTDKEDDYYNDRFRQTLWEKIGQDYKIHPKESTNISTLNNAMKGLNPKGLDELINNYKEFIDNNFYKNQNMRKLSIDENKAIFDLLESFKTGVFNKQSSQYQELRDKVTDKEIASGQNPLYNIGVQLFELLSKIKSISEIGKIEGFTSIPSRYGNLKQLKGGQIESVINSFKDKLKPINADDIEKKVKERDTINNTSKAKAFTGQYMLENLIRHNQSKETAEYDTRTIIEGKINNLKTLINDIILSANEKGLGVFVDVDSKGDIIFKFFDNADNNAINDEGLVEGKYSPITLALDDGTGVLNVDGMLKTNLTIADADSEGEGYLISLMEEQAKAILNVVKTSSNEETGYVGFADQIKKLQDFAQGTRMLKRRKREAIDQSSSTSIYRLAAKEAADSLKVTGTPESKFTKQGFVDVTKFLTAIWKQSQKAEGNPDAQITEKDLTNLVELLGVISSGELENEKVTLSKESQELYNIDFIRNAIENFIKKHKLSYYGLNEDPITTSRRFSLGSSDIIEPGGEFKISSDRSSVQSYNKARQVINEDIKKGITRSPLFGSTEIDFNTTDRRTFKLGFLTDEIIAQNWEEIKQVVIEANKRRKDQGRKEIEIGDIPPTVRDAFIAGKKMGDALAAYIYPNYAINQKDVNENYIKYLGQHGFKSGENTIEHTVQTAIRLGTKNGRDIVADPGDIVKTWFDGEKYVFDLQKAVYTQEGIKAVGGGLRVTESAEFDDDLIKIIGAVIGKNIGADFNGVQGFVEDRWLKDRNFGDIFQMRMNYLFGEFANQYITNYVDEQLKKENITKEKLKEVREKRIQDFLNNPQSGPMQDVIKFINGQIQQMDKVFADYFTLDLTQGKIVKTGNANINALIHDNKFINMASGLNENEEMSYYNQLAQKLFGDAWKTIVSRKVADIPLNLFNNNPTYNNPVGSVSVEELEKFNRVRLASREQDAMQRNVGMLAVQNNVGKEVIESFQEMLTYYENNKSEKKKQLQENSKIVMRSIIDTLEKDYEDIRKPDDIIVDASQNGELEGEAQTAISKLLRNYVFENGGLAEEDYENTPIGILRKMANGAERAVLQFDPKTAPTRQIKGEDGSYYTQKINSLIIPLIKPTEMGDGRYVYDEINKATAVLLKALSDAKKSPENYQQAISKAVENYETTLIELTSNKEGSYFKTLSSYAVPNASSVKTSGLNIEYVREHDELRNTVLTSKEQMEATFQYFDNGKDTSENIKKRTAHLRQLLNMLEEVNGELIRTIQTPNGPKTIDYIKENKEVSEHFAENYENFQKLQKKVIELIAEKITYNKLNGENQKYLYSFINRPPSLNGLDMPVARMMIDPTLKGIGVIRTSPDLEAATKLDYDGDVVRYWLGLGGVKKNGEFNEQDFKNVEKGKKQLEEIYRKAVIATKTAMDKNDSYEKGNNKIKFGTLLSNKEIEDIQTILESNEFVGFMSRANKRFTGGFSNVATSMRGALFSLNLDERGLREGNPQSISQAVTAVVTRAIFEQLEQDPISSKKINQRLLSYAYSMKSRNNDTNMSMESIEKYAMNAVEELLRKLQSGDVKQIQAAIEEGVKIGVFSESTLNTEKSLMSLNMIGQAYGEIGVRALAKLGIMPNEDILRQKIGKDINYTSIDEILKNANIKDIVYTSMDVNAMKKAIAGADSLARNTRGKTLGQLQYEVQNRAGGSNINYRSRYATDAVFMELHGHRPKYGEGIFDSGTIFGDTYKSRNERISALERVAKGDSSRTDKALYAAIKDTLTNGSSEDKIKVASDFFGERIRSEEEAVRRLNEVLGKEHKQAMDTAIAAEQAKIATSKDLEKQMGKEQQATEQAGEAFRKEQEQASKFNWNGKSTGAEFFIPRFEDSNGQHQYYKPIKDENGKIINYEKIYSGTQFRDALINGLTDGAYIKDRQKYEDILQDIISTNKGQINFNDLESIKNAKKINITDVGATSQNAFDTMINGIATGLKGDLFHNLIDTLTPFKGKIESIESLESLANSGSKEAEKAKNALDKFNQFREEVNQKLVALGKNPSEYVPLEKMLSNYMDMFKKLSELSKQKTGKELSFTDFSEIRLGATLKGDKGDISYGITPDQLLNLFDGFGAIFDNKTGKVKGYEGFQLSLQALATRLGADSKEVIPELGLTVRQVLENAGIDLGKQFRLFISDVKEGSAALTEFLPWTNDEIYNMLWRSLGILKYGDPKLSEEEKGKLYRGQLSTGAIFGGDLDSINERIFGKVNLDSENSIISKRLTLVKSIQMIEQDINNLREKGTKKDNEQIQAKKQLKEALINQLKAEADITRENGVITSIGGIKLTDQGREKYKRDRDIMFGQLNDRQTSLNAKLNSNEEKEFKKYLEEYIKGYKEYIELTKQWDKLESKKNNEGLNNKEIAIQNALTARLKLLKEIADYEIADENKLITGANGKFLNIRQNENGTYDQRKLTDDNYRYLNNEFIKINQEKNESLLKSDQLTAEQRKKIEEDLTKELVRLAKERNDVRTQISKLQTDSVLHPEKTEINNQSIKDLKEYLNELRRIIDVISKNGKDILGLDIFHTNTDIKNSNRDTIRVLREQNFIRNNTQEQEKVKQEERIISDYINNITQKYKNLKEIQELINKQRKVSPNSQEWLAYQKRIEELTEQLKRFKKERKELFNEGLNLGITPEELGKKLQGDAYNNIVTKGEADLADIRVRGQNYSQINSSIRSYLNNLKEQQKIERDIYKIEQQINVARPRDLQNLKNYNVALHQRQQDLQAMQLPYDQQLKKLQELGATESQIAEFEKKINEQRAQGSLAMSKLQASYKAQVPLVDRIFKSFKQALSYMSLTSMISRSIWKIQSMFRTLIQYAKDLNSSMVDIQIASNMGLPEAQKNMFELNKLAKQLGMTTSEMASAQNDWLRAGYRGTEVMELTKASATLSKLGMIETSEATSYLVSTLKGWKLEAESVMDVVSKLTAVDSAAAISAGDLAEAMSRANNSAANAGIEMNRYIGLLTVGADVTQRAPESIGQAWNTLIARMGNVKAGKFNPTKEDENSEDYEEQNFEALNDVEKVLGKVGIKLRENYGTWRDTQDVIDDIAIKWNDWDKTTQNAVSTAVAGTRQREIFAATMNNYDKVAKYEMIAANSYGTAQQKMEAYSDSITAAQKRYQAALEEFSLHIAQWGVIKNFYDALAFAVNNIHSLIAAFGMLAMAIKGKDIVYGLSNGIVGAGIRFSNFSIGGLDKIKGANSENPGVLSNFKSAITTNYIQQYEQAYATSLTNATSALDVATRQRYINLQNLIMESDATQKGLGIELLKQSLTGQVSESLVQQLLMNEQGRAILEQYLGTTMEKITMNAQQLEQEGKLQQGENALLKATMNLIGARNKNASVTTKGAETEVLNNTKNFNKITNGNSEIAAKTTLASGIASVAGMTLGGVIWGDTAENIIGSQGKMLGMMLGGIAVSEASKIVVSNFIPVITSSGLQAAIAAGLPGLIIGGITIAITALMAWANSEKKKAEELIKKQAEEFKVESNKYQEMLNGSVNASRFDELSKGVDRLGRNITLTDEEYQEFLNINTELAKQFPSLISHTDGYGQAFVTASEGANTLVESIDNLIKQQQKLADEKMLAPELFKDTYETAKRKYEKAKKELEEAQKKSQSQELFTFSESKQLYKINSNGIPVSLGEGRDIIPINGANYNEIAQILKEAKIDFNQEGHNETTGYNTAKYVIDSITISEKDYQEAIDKINKLQKNYDFQLVQLESNLEDSRHELDEQVKAILRLLSFEDQDIYENFNTELFNSLTEDEKSIVMNAVIGIAPEFKDEKDFEQQIAIYTQQIQTAIKKDKDNLMLTYGLEYDESMSMTEFNKGREQLVNYIKRTFGKDSDITKILLIKFGFHYEEDGSLTDDRNILGNIYKDGLSDKVNVDLKDSVIARYSIEDLKIAYDLLKNSIRDTAYEENELITLIMQTKYGEMGPVELARAYEDITEKIKDTEKGLDGLGETEKASHSAIIKNVKEWGKKLNIPADKYDEIIDKLKRIPGLQNNGTSSLTPEEVNDYYDKIQEYYEYMKNDFKGSWDVDKVAGMMELAGSDSSFNALFEYIGTDAKKLTELLKQYTNEYDDVFNRSMAGRLAETKEGSQALIRIHANEVNKFAEDYGIDLNNFDNLVINKEQLNEALINEMIRRTAEGIDELPKAYLVDEENFRNSILDKIKMLGIFESAFKKIAQLGQNLQTSDNPLAQWLGKGIEGGMSGLQGMLDGKRQELYDYLNNSGISDAAESALSEVTTIKFKKAGVGDNSGSGSGDAFKEQLQNMLDILKNYRNLIDKEWEAMLAWDENAKIDNGTKYFEKMRENITAQITATQEMIDNMYAKAVKIDANGNKTYWNIDDLTEQITQKEFMEQINTHEADLIALQKDLNNLDDEEIEDMKKIAQLKQDILEFDNEHLGLYKDYNDYLKRYKQGQQEVKASLQAQLELARKALEAADTEEEHLEKIKEIKELERQISDIDYEILEHEQNILELRDASIEALIDIQSQLVAQSRTQEELIENENKLYDLYKQQRDTQKEIYEYQIKNLERTNKYFSSNSYTKSDRTNPNLQGTLDYYDKIKDNRTEKMDASWKKKYNQLLLEKVNGDKVLSRDNTWMTKEDAVLLDEYVQGYINAKTDDEKKEYHRLANELRANKYGYDGGGDGSGRKVINDKLWESTQAGEKNRWTQTEAYRKAFEDEDYRNSLQEWWDADDAQVDAIIQDWKNKISEVDRQLQELEDSKPDKWSKFGDIGDYSEKRLTKLQEKATLIREALNDVGRWTDEQIEDMVNELRDVQKAIIEQTKQEVQEEIDYNDKEFDALVDWINEKIDALKDLEDEIDKYYDALLPPLEQELEDRKKNAELLQLENNLLQAREKSRVYRQGIGWVYESNHKKEKEALKAIDDFKLQQEIDDLNDAKDEEKKLLNEMIEQWELYLKALNWEHDAFDRQQRDELIMEMMGADTMEEAENRIMADWRNFNETCKGSYKEYNGEFTAFLKEYSDKLEEFDTLSKKWNELTSADEYLDKNDNITLGPSISSSEDIANSMNMSEEDKSLLALAQKGWQQAHESGQEELAKIWHEFADSIRKKYGYYGGDDGADRIYLTDEEKAELNEMVEYNGRMMTKNERNIEEYKLMLSQHFSDINTTRERYYAREWSNVLEHQSNLLEENGINKDSLANWLSYNSDTRVQYDLATMEFSDFIDKYATEITRYEEEIKRYMDANNIVSEYEAAKEYGLVSFGTVDGKDQVLVQSRDGTWMTKEDAALLESYGKGWQQATTVEEKNEWNRKANELRKKYGYDGGGDGSGREIVSQTNWNNTQSGSKPQIVQNIDNTIDRDGLIKAAVEGYQKAKAQDDDTLANLWHDVANSVREMMGINGGDDGSGTEALSEERIRELNKLVTYEGRTMTKREANLKNSLSKVINYMASSDNNYKQYNTNEWNNILSHEQNLLKEYGLNSEVVSNWINFNTNTKAQYDLQHREFGDFIREYSGQIREYQDLLNDMQSKNEEYKKLSIDQLAIKNGNFDSGKSPVGSGTTSSSGIASNKTNSSITPSSNPSSSNGSGNGSSNSNYPNYALSVPKGGFGTESDRIAVQHGMSDADRINLHNDGLAWAYYNSIGDKTRAASVAADAAAIRKKYGYSGGGDGSQNLSSYATGIDNGPVTYTGLAMLHGTPSAPEYVLNSQQATNLLYNLAHAKLPEFTHNTSTEVAAPVYNLYGDIVIDGTSDPREFWSNVTKNMNNRSNVTKNR